MTSESGSMPRSPISIGDASMARASCTSSALFSSARRACQFPSAMPAAQAAAASATAQARGRKEYPDGMRYGVIAMLLAIVGRLASACGFLLRGRGDSRRTARALALRGGLAVALCLMLMASYFLGVFPPGRL